MSLFDHLVVAGLPLVPKFIVGRVASRYVAGETLAEAVTEVQALNASGCMVTMDLLGEETRDPKAAEAAAEMYLQVLDAIETRGIDGNISVKPTQLGLQIDSALCRRLFERVVEKAAGMGNFVRLDMEDRTTTDATLELYRYLHGRYGHVGVVFQSYMRRTLRDIAELPREGANVRLCKGIYIEPRPVAWKGFETVRANFVAALEKLFHQGAYVGIATHDEFLLAEAVALIDRLGLSRDQYEFQMLLGVEPVLRQILVDEGHRLRVYVPFGEDWYLYSVRRLRENPEIARHVTKAFLRGE